MVPPKIGKRRERGDGRQSNLLDTIVFQLIGAGDFLGPGLTVRPKHLAMPTTTAEGKPSRILPDSAK